MPVRCGADIVYFIVKICAMIAMVLTLGAVRHIVFFFFTLLPRLSFNQIKIASNIFAHDLFSSVNMEIFYPSPSEVQT